MTMMILLDGQAPEPRLETIARRMTEHRPYSHKRVADVRPIFSDDGRILGTIWRIDQKAWAQATREAQVRQERPTPLSADPA